MVGGNTMRKILTGLVAAASISGAAIATSSNAEAWRGWWLPGAVAGGVVAGAVVGAGGQAAHDGHIGRKNGAKNYWADASA